MYRRFSAPDYIIFGLLVIGILSSVVRNPAPFIIPLVVFGVIFLLYKFPPDAWKRSRSVKPKRRGHIRQSERERRKSSFRVIYGNKHDSEDEPPQYH